MKGSKKKIKGNFEVYSSLICTDFVWMGIFSKHQHKVALGNGSLLTLANNINICKKTISAKKILQKDKKSYKIR